MDYTSIESIFIIEDSADKAESLFKELVNLTWLSEARDLNDFNSMQQEQIRKYPTHLEGKVYKKVLNPQTSYEDIQIFMSLLAKEEKSIAFIDFALDMGNGSRSPWYESAIEYFISISDAFSEAATGIDKPYLGGYLFCRIFDPKVLIKPEENYSCVKLVYAITISSMAVNKIRKFSHKYECINPGVGPVDSNDASPQNIVFKALLNWTELGEKNDLTTIWNEAKDFFSEMRFVDKDDFQIPHTCPVESTQLDKCLRKIESILRLQLPRDSTLQDYKIYPNIHEPLKHMCGHYYCGSEVGSPSRNKNLNIGSIFILLLLASKYVNFQLYQLINTCKWYDESCIDLESIFLDSQSSSNAKETAKCIYFLLCNIFTCDPKHTMTGVEKIDFPDKHTIQIHLNWSSKNLFDENIEDGLTRTSLNKIRLLLGQDEFDRLFKFSDKTFKICGRIKPIF